MQENLEEYKRGAQEIVKEYSLRDKDKILNYILVGFSDPGESHVLYKLHHNYCFCVNSAVN